TAFLHALAGRVRDGCRVKGVPTSEETERLARELGIPLVGLEADLDLTVDGADEVDPELNLIKGYGGALVRERIVAAASARLLILVTRDKLVEVLGSHGRLPVEVLPFALPLCRRRLEAIGWPRTGKTASLWGRNPRLRTATGEASWMGWLDVVDHQLAGIAGLRRMAEEIRSAGFGQAVVLGMGGSSLCPDVLRATFGRI